MTKIGVLSDTHLPGPDKRFENLVAKHFSDVDAIVYGHTHQAFCGCEAGIFFFNPGSPTDSRFTTTCSVGIINIDKRLIQGEVIPL